MTSLTFPSTDLTVGAMFLGSTFSAVFYGMTIIQVIIYYHAFPHDPPLHKASVAFLWLLDTFHIILTTHSVYHYTVGQFGNIVKLLQLVWSSKLQAVVNSIIVLTVQSLYAVRVWKLRGYNHGALGYLAAAIILVGFGVGIVLAYELFTIPSLLQISSISWAIKASLATSAALDVTITIIVFLCLRRSQSVLTSLKSRLAIVIVYTLISGFATSICAIAALIAYILLPNSFMYVALGFIVTRLHVNSFLGLLNTRPRTLHEKTGSGPSLSLRSHTRVDSRSQRPWHAGMVRSSSEVGSPMAENAPSMHSGSTSCRDLVPTSSSPPADREEMHSPNDYIARAV